MSYFMLAIYYPPKGPPHSTVPQDDPLPENTLKKHFPEPLVRILEVLLSPKLQLLLCFF